MYYAEPSESIKIFFIKFVLFAYHPSTTAKKEIPYRIQKICIMEKELPPMDKHKKGDVCLYSHRSAAVVEIVRILNDPRGVAEIKFLKVIVDNTGTGLFEYLHRTGKTMNASLKYLKILPVDDRPGQGAETKHQQPDSKGQGTESQHRSSVGKLVAILNEDDGTLNTIIQVNRYDDNFPELLSSVTCEWQDTDAEFYDLLRERAREAGYEIEFPDFMTFSC